MYRHEFASYHSWVSIDDIYVFIEIEMYLVPASTLKLAEKSTISQFLGFPPP